VGRESDLIFIEETIPRNLMPLPVYISRLQFYTECECRQIFRQFVEFIRISHENCMAHRNLQMNNYFVDHMVSYDIEHVVVTSKRTFCKDTHYFNN
jgi:hypothetical protein